MDDDRTRDRERDPAQPDAQGRIRYGGGHQEGGGMIEPDEFADGGTDVLDEQPDHGTGRTVPSPSDTDADPPR